MTKKVRQEMGEIAVRVAKAVNYDGAGTVEFIVDDDLNYYFLEMNTRLQVEHPITERVVGIDLVTEQLKIADGEILDIKQTELFQDGHAIECRIYAEDPDNNFMPNPGVIKHITEPLGLGVRHDGYVYEGYEIPIFYDPLISKLIIWGKTRKEAIDRMKRALYAYKITGIKTTIKFLERIMEIPDFVNGKYNTHFIEENKEALFSYNKGTTKMEDIAMITAYFDYVTKLEKIQPQRLSNTLGNNWKDFGRKKGVLRM